MRESLRAGSSAVARKRLVVETPVERWPVGEATDAGAVAMILAKHGTREIEVVILDYRRVQGGMDPVFRHESY